MFNKELKLEIEELKRKLLKEQLRNSELAHENDMLVQKLSRAEEIESSMPNGCVRGEWCKACNFSTTLHARVYEGHGQYSLERFTVCNKGNSCENFVQKEYEIC